MVKMNSEKEENVPLETPNLTMVSPMPFQYSNGLSASFICVQSLSNLPDGSIDLSVEEIQNKLKDVVEENLKLKDTIQQNSCLMREQYSSLIKWRDQIKDAEVRQLSKYEETKQVVLQLRQDKKELEENVKELEVKLHQNNSVVKENNLLKDQLHESQQEISKLQILCQQESESPVLVNLVQNEELQNQFALLEVEHKSSTEEKLKLKVKIKQLVEEREELNRIMNDMVLESNTIQNNHERLEHDNGELIKTKNELKQELEKSYNEVRKLSDAYQRMQLEKQDLMALNNDLSTQVANMKQRCSLLPLLDGSFTFVESNASCEDTMDRPVNKPLPKSSRAMSDLLIQLQEERGKISILTSQITEQQAMIEELQKELRRKEEKLNHSGSDNFTSIQHEAKVEELFSNLESLNHDIQQQHLQSNVIQMAEDIQRLKHQVLSLVSELNESESKFKTVDQSLIKYRNRCCELEHRMTLAQEELESLQTKDDALIDQLRVEIDSMESRFIMCKQQSDTYKKTLEELRNKYDRLCKDYEEIHCTLEMQEKAKCQNVKPMSVEWIQERKTLLNRIDGLIAQLMSFQESISNKDVELQNLKDENNRIKKNIDMVPLLQAQVEVYRDDFNAEREARERQHSEIEKFQEDIRQLQLHNQQLLDEINMFNQDRLREMQVRHASNNEGAQATGGLAAAEISSPIKYYCPKCQKSYTDVDVLQRHVEDCLDNDNPFVM